MNLNKSVRWVTTAALMSAASFTGRLLFQSIPNVQPLTTIIIICTLVFGFYFGSTVAILSIMIFNLFLGMNIGHLSRSGESHIPFHFIPRFGPIVKKIYIKKQP